MLKILYAASNNSNAKIALQRFIANIENEPYIIKIAAYKISSPQNISIDWTLDCLLNMFKPGHMAIDDNDNLLTYFEQIKYYSPDLIISDLEYFTSYVANVLNIKLWQCSSSLINYSLESDEKYNLGLFKNYSYLSSKNPKTIQRIINIISNSDKNFIYSHFGDIATPPKIKNNFEWVRPYHAVGKPSIPCIHNIISGTLKNNKKIFSILQKYNDSVSFSEFIDERYDNIKLKNYNNQEEYFCNLKNSNLLICEGQTSFLADAFYNNKYSIVLPDFNDLECLTNSAFTEKIGLGSCIYDNNTDLNKYMEITVNSGYKETIKFLHEKLKEI